MKTLELALRRSTSPVSPLSRPSTCKVRKPYSIDCQALRLVQGGDAGVAILLSVVVSDESVIRSALTPETPRRRRRIDGQLAALDVCFAGASTLRSPLVIRAGDAADAEAHAVKACHDFWGRVVPAPDALLPEPMPCLCLLTTTSAASCVVSRC